MHSRQADPRLTFSPQAWLKLQCFCHMAETEIGGFGISTPDNPLYILDFQTVRQDVTFATVRFRDDAVADYFDNCVDQGIPPERAGRVWLHTHPGSSPEPSSQDETTFLRSFGRCDWSVMFILGRTGLTYARLAFSAGPGAQMLIPVAVDWSAWPLWLTTGTLLHEVAAWQEEYLANIHVEQQLVLRPEPSAENCHDRPFRRWWEMHPWNQDFDSSLALDLEDDDREHLELDGPRRPSA